MFVRKKMTANFYHFSDKTIPDAQELMAKHNIRRLPVLKNGKLVVSKEDILRASLNGNHLKHW